MSEKLIRNIVKLYEARDAMRKLHGCGWRAQVDSVSPIIRRFAEESNSSILEAAISIAGQSAKDGRMMNSVMVLAVACEILDNLYQSESTKKL
jgi:hypothetical protein